MGKFSLIKTKFRTWLKTLFSQQNLTHFTQKISKIVATNGEDIIELNIFFNRNHPCKAVKSLKTKGVTSCEKIRDRNINISAGDLKGLILDSDCHVIDARRLAMKSMHPVVIGGGGEWQRRGRGRGEKVEDE